MTTSAQGFLDREAAAWAAFEANVDRVPQDRRDQPGVVGDWTVKDVVWHCAYWSGFAADHLATEGESFTDPFDAHPDAYWDDVNAQVAAASAAMSWEDVVEGTHEARERLRAAVARPGIAAVTVEWAADESWIHYDEHGAHVEAFVATLSP
jgi:hypothetical protein